MSLSAKIREQLISSFRAELAEHIQTMTNGLLALEQHKVAGEQRQSMLEDVFRAAHSLKGAARAMGVTTVEQLAHALEDVLAAMQHDAIEPTPELFTACYRALDAIQMVQAIYESGGTALPAQVLQTLADLETFRHGTESAKHGAESVKCEDIVPLPAVSQPTSQPVASQSVNAIASTHPERDTHVYSRQPISQPATSNQQPVPPDETIRVSVSKLDALMAQLSELLVTKIRAEQRLAQVRQAQEFTSLWQKEWLSVRGVYSRLARDGHGVGGNGAIEKDTVRLLNYMGASQERLREMGALMNNLSREYANDTMHMALVIDELEQEIKRARMLPLSTITGSFGRMVRDLAQTAGKETVLEIEGAEVELDKRVLEQIKDPLTHLLRNAIDHGIESPEQRAAAGKPRSGTITLAAEQLGKEVVICISDDGSGLDMDGIRRAAVRRGIADVQVLSEAELVELIFNAGFSTSPIITDVSGRGVGLDVVRRNVEALRGRISVDWKAGAGSTFTLTLPLALTSSRGLLVRVSNDLFAIPLNSIERILHISPDQITSLGGHDTLRYNGRPLTLVHLGDVLNLPRVQHGNSQQDKTNLPVIILAAAEKRLAFAVDELAGEQEVVIKGLGKQLARVGGIAGATVMGSGEVILILNVADVIKLAMRGERRSVLTPAETTAPITTRAQRHILIVDDSITTRTLEKNILEAAGYVIQLATDGQEALGAVAAGGLPDLIISDVAMPRLDGFGLAQRIKGDPRTANVPLILVTSLDSPEDKARGIEVGADAYIVKSSFDQTNLLETIEQLI